MFRACDVGFASAASASRAESNRGGCCSVHPFPISRGEHAPGSCCGRNHGAVPPTRVHNDARLGGLDADRETFAFGIMMFAKARTSRPAVRRLSRSPGELPT